jgi:hypothetical protein
MATTQMGSSSTGHGDGAQAGNGIIGKARERATAQLTEQKNKAVDGIGSVTQAVRQSTQQLRDQQHDTLAQYVERAANQIDRLAQQLRDKDVGDLFEDAQRLARRQPALFIGSAFALGLIGARFLKSSSRRQDADEGTYEWGGSSAGDTTWSATSPATERTSAVEFGAPVGGVDVSDTGATAPSGTPSGLATSSAGRRGTSHSTGTTSTTPRVRKSTDSGRE